MTEKQKILLAHLYNRLSFVMCNPEAKIGFIPQNEMTIEELIKNLDKTYEEYRKATQEKESKKVRLKKNGTEKEQR